MIFSDLLVFYPPQVQFWLMKSLGNQSVRSNSLLGCSHTKIIHCCSVLVRFLTWVLKINQELYMWSRIAWQVTRVENLAWPPHKISHHLINVGDFVWWQVKLLNLNLLNKFFEFWKSFKTHFPHYRYTSINWALSTLSDSELTHTHTHSCSAHSSTQYCLLVTGVYHLSCQI